MKWNAIRLLSVIVFSTAAWPAFAQNMPAADLFISYTVDAGKKDIQLYWKNDTGENFRSIQHLKDQLEKKHKKLVFAMNAGMYKKDNAPLGLFIERGATVSPLNKIKGEGNFYLQPNGVFFLTRDNLAVICATNDFRNRGNIKYATQSGPLLLVDGQINPVFKEGSANLNIRNGVGILPDGSVIFAMSKQAVNFYDFANFFRTRGCKNALYLDGFVSRTYLPEKGWVQMDGNFGVMIGITEHNR